MSRGQGLYCSEYRIQNIENFIVKSFLCPDSEWLKIIMQGREGRRMDADIVISLVADAQIKESLYQLNDVINKLNSIACT